MNIFTKILTAIKVSDNDQFIKTINEKDKEITILKNSINELSEQCEYMDKLIDEKTRIILLKDSEIEKLKPKDTELDKYCSNNYKIIKPIAYKNKMKFNDKKYSVFLHELIKPESFEVQKLKKGINDPNGKYTLFKKYADKISETLTWTDDKNLDTSGDLYLYPSQAIALKNCDCEDHAVTLASFDEEIGMAWGFYYPQTKKLNPNKCFGHAFNVFVHEGKLYILETTGDSGEIEEYTGDNHYYINYIITRKNYYELDGSARFGELAGWE